MSNVRFFTSLITGALTGIVVMNICQKYNIDFVLSLLLIIPAAAGCNTIVQMLLPKDI